MRPNDGRHSGLDSGRTDFSLKQLRELRKEVLVTRAAVERMAIREAKVDLSQKMSRFGWLGLVLPGFAHRADAGSGEKILSAVPEFLRPVLQAFVPLLRRHPLYSALLSFLIRTPGTSTAARGAAGPAKWVGALLLGVKAFGFWRRFRGSRKSRQRLK